MTYSAPPNRLPGGLLSSGRERTFNSMPLSTRRGRGRGELGQLRQRDIVFRIRPRLRTRVALQDSRRRNIHITRSIWWRH